MLPYLPGRLSHFGFSHCVFMNVLLSSGMLPETLLKISGCFMENLLCCVIWAWCFFFLFASYLKGFLETLQFLKHLSCFAVVFLYSHKSSGMSCFLNYSLVRFLCCWCYFHIFLILITFFNVPFCRNVISETYFWFCCYVTCTGHVVSWMCFLKWNFFWNGIVIS